MMTNDGGLYVALNPEGDPQGAQVLHPALNLASARLAAGKSDGPTIVDEDVLERYPRGLPVGIPGAPNSLEYFQPSETTASWGVCNATNDDSRLSLTTTEALQTTVVAGAATWSGGDILPEDGEQALVVTTDEGTGEVFLVWGRWKAKLPDDDSRTLAAFGLTGTDLKNAATVSQGVLDMLETRPTLAMPTIPRLGEESSMIPGHHVGDVVVTEGASGQRFHHVVMDDGVQAVSPIIAEILLQHGAALFSASDVGRLSEVPESHTIPVGNYPSVKPLIVHPVAVCGVWEKAVNASKPELHVVVGRRGLPITDEALDNRVELAPSSKGRVAGFYAGPKDRGWFTQTVGASVESVERGQVSYIDSSGIRYDVAATGDERAQTLGALGLTGLPMPIPEPVARMFASGPDLSREAAVVERVRDRGEDAASSPEPEGPETVTVVETVTASPPAGEGEGDEGEPAAPAGDGEPAPGD